ncbi:MAG: iron-containing redox enzyme family protein [Rickettsiaceae bacterium]|nr:iron-containing redox enzyme family protein [Rickettsiaceae bacterium]
MTTQTAPRVTQHAASILNRIGIFENPYFKSLKNGDMDIEQFRRSQEQFYFAVIFFSRPMVALVGRIPNAKDRLDILHNVLEEHGCMNQDDFHGTTFQKFLSSIKSTAKLDDITLSPQIRAFNSVLTTSCTFDEIEVGIGCMGIIEMAFGEISAIIGKAILERGWIKQEELVHYKLHAEIDYRHAEEFFRVVEKHWDDPKRQYFIKQGLELGAYIFDQLYKNLLDV